MTKDLPIVLLVLFLGAGAVYLVQRETDEFEPYPPEDVEPFTPAVTGPYWYVELARLYPEIPIRVGPDK